MAREDMYTYIFGGGAVRGFAYIGAIKALEKLGLRCDTYVGSSVGAIIAAFLAVGLNSENIEGNFSSINFELFRDIHIGLGKNFALSKGEIFTQWVRDNIEKKYYGENYRKDKNPPVTFSMLNQDLVIYTTDLNTFKCNEFSKQVTPDFEVADAVRISCSMPGLMTPTDFEGKNLVDGDLLKSMPLWKLSSNLKHGKNRILEFRLEGEYEKVENNAIDFFNAIYSCMTSAATEHIISIYGDNDDFDYIKINTGDVIILDFNMSQTKRQKLVESGYKQTMDAFKATIAPKRQRALILYKSVSKIFMSLLDFIKSNDVKRARVILGELFILVCSQKNLLSQTLYEKIALFKNEFLDSASGKTIFGYPRFKNKKGLLKSLTRLIFDVNVRIEKLENHQW